MLFVPELRAYLKAAGLLQRPRGLHELSDAWHPVGRREGDGPHVVDRGAA